LGTVIAFDYLSELFEEEKLFVPSPEAATQADNGSVQCSLTSEDITLLKNQFRHFFSMGSPIGLFLLRKGALWMSNDSPFAALHNPIRGKDRVWRNFWDTDDPIAYPLARLFGENLDNAECQFLDIPVETGWLLDSHLRYWKNEEVATEIMRFLKGEQITLEYTVDYSNPPCCQV
jgi:hypothetical protein